MIDRQTGLCWVLPDMAWYHYARIDAFARTTTAPVQVIELCDTSSFREFKFQWHDERKYELSTLFHGKHYTELTVPQIEERLWRFLDQLRPSVLLIQGWSEQFALAPLRWALRTETPAIVASESQECDHSRKWLKEWIKKRVIQSFSAALVGGSLR